jgi:hypothetical protein
MSSLEGFLWAKTIIESVEQEDSLNTTGIGAQEI